MSTMGAALSVIACCAGAASLALPVDAAETPREVHGSADTFSAPGVALAWSVLRGANEAATVVVVRVVTHAAAFPDVSITGSDPFTQRRQPMPLATRGSGVFEWRVPRAHFADYPRTELRFHDAARAPPNGAVLVVFYLGVPDTTPEFLDETKLDVYLRARIADLSGAKAP